MNIASARLAIGALATRTGSNVETIRYYERAGLLPAPARSAGGYRLYGSGHLKRLTFIRRARALGFSIDQVRRLLDLADHRRRACAEVRDLAAAHLADVRAKIPDLQAMERALAETVARCADSRSVNCAVIDALYRGGPPSVQGRDAGSHQRLAGPPRPPRRSGNRLPRRAGSRLTAASGAREGVERS